MTILTQLERWKDSGVISSEQHKLLGGLSRGEPFSIFLELNILLYGGILAFVAGLGWTVSTWSQQLGDVVMLTILSAMLAACFWYVFSRAAPWSPRETPSPNLVFDYVLYLGSLIWSVEFSYIETRFHLLFGQWGLYLLMTACLFFFLAIVLITASCCRLLCPRSLDVSDSPSCAGRPITTQRTGGMPFSTA